MMRDIAQGVGVAARILPEASRSEVGAVALKRASVEIDFEMTAAARRSDGTVGIGARTFLIGLGASSSDVESRARNSGRITLEIVAVADPGAAAAPEPASVIDRPLKPDAPEPQPEPAPALDPAEIKAALNLLRREIDRRLTSGAIAQDVATQARGLANEAELRMGAGDLAGAAKRVRAGAQLIGLGR